MNGHVETKAFGAAALSTITELLIDQIEFRPVIDRKWVSSDTSPTATPAPNSDNIGQGIDSSEVEGKIEELLLTIPTTENANTAKLRTFEVNQIYRDIWRREPTPTELGRALGELENGRSYDEVRAKVKASRNSVLMILEQYITLRR